AVRSGRPRHQSRFRTRVAAGDGPAWIERGRRDRDRRAATAGPLRAEVRPRERRDRLVRAMRLADNDAGGSRPALAIALAAVAALAAFLRPTPEAFPSGDGAIVEIYTLEAARHFLTLGPYSQFNWHHPGPIYFYLLVPLYKLAGQRAIGLTAGALAINVAALA